MTVSDARKLLSLVSNTDVTKLSECSLIHEWWNSCWVQRKSQLSDITEILNFALRTLSRKQSQGALKAAAKELDAVDETDLESVETAVEEFFEVVIKQLIIEKVSPPNEALISEPSTVVDKKSSERTEDEEDASPRSLKKAKVAPAEFSQGLTINPFDWCKSNLRTKVSKPLRV